MNIIIDSRKEARFFMIFLQLSQVSVNAKKMFESEVGPIALQQRISYLLQVLPRGGLRSSLDQCPGLERPRQHFYFTLYGELWAVFFG
jgi:hypothetical protein